MKDFINPISDNEIKKIYDLLNGVILVTSVSDEEFIKKDEFSIDYHYALQYAKDKKLPFPKEYAKSHTKKVIKRKYINYIFDSFLDDEYCKFYTLGQFQKMLNKAIDRYIDENYN